jgi:hypothetical protein
VATPDLPVLVHRVLHHSGKAVTATGELYGARVVVKLLLSDDPFWRARLAHEVTVYRHFADDPPPVRVPGMAGTDGSTWLALEHLPGRPLGTGRYMTSAPDPGDLAAVLGAVRVLRRWEPASPDFGGVHGYDDRIAHYHAAGFLSGQDVDALLALLARCGDRREFCHGDLLPSNIWLTGAASCALLDWEYAGWYLPGYDLAMLHVTAGDAVPGLRRRIGGLIARDRQTRAAFCVNLARVLARERRLHSELDPANPARTRIPAIERSWNRARRLILREAALVG